MHPILSTPVPWYIVGPGMGLCVTGLYALSNKHLGVSGSYVQILDAARGRALESWRLWFLAGMLVGGALLTLLSGHPQGIGYGHLGRVVSPAVLVALLLTGGMLLGFGTRWAGACTSGHGITGCSTRSPGSLLAIATYIGVAVGVTFVLHALTGGVL